MMMMMMLTNDSDILTNTMNEEELMSDDEKNVPICQGGVLKSLDTISYASNNGMTKSGR